jgi:hypothetical protein
MTRHDISAEEWEIVQYYRRRAKRIAHAKKLRRNKGRSHVTRTVNRESPDPRRRKTRAK